MTSQSERIEWKVMWSRGACLGWGWMVGLIVGVLLTG